MSIILKALKKVEESKIEGDVVGKTHAYQANDKKALWIILACFAGAILVFSVGIYLFKSISASKLTVKKMAKIVDVKSKNIVETGGKEEAVVAEGPDVARLHETAMRQIKEKNYPGAESILRKALLIKPADAVMHNHLGLVLKNQSRYKEASVAYERALQLNPDYCEAMNNLAVTQEMLGDREGAKALYKKALSIKPSYAEAHLNYALLLEAEGNNLGAVSHYYTFLNLSTDGHLKDKVKERLKALRK